MAPVSSLADQPADDDPVLVTPTVLTGIDRRDVIVDKAAELFARRGVAATTVREIAEAAGILSGSLYHHFRSKDDIVDAIIAAFLEDIVSRYQAVVARTEDATERLHGLIHASLECVEAHPHATEIYQNDANYLWSNERFAYVHEAAATVRQTWIRVFEAGVSSGVLRDDVPPRVMYPLLRDGLWRSVRWFQPTPEYDRVALAEDCYRLFLQGVRRPAEADGPAAPPPA